jgi:hypothetical protein
MSAAPEVSRPQNWAGEPAESRAKADQSGLPPGAPPGLAAGPSPAPRLPQVGGRLYPV